MAKNPSSEHREENFAAHIRLAGVVVGALGLWGMNQTVTPPDTARLEGALNVRVQDVCAGSGVGHGGLVRDPLVLGLVARALDGAMPRPPAPADCAALRASGTRAGG